MCYIASKLIQDHEYGQVTVERTESPFSVKAVSQQSCFNNLFHQLNSHITSFFPTFTKPGKYRILGKDDQTNRRSLVVHKLVLEVKQCITRKIQVIFKKSSSKWNELLVNSGTLKTGFVACKRNVLHHTIQIQETLSKEKGKHGRGGE